MKPGGSLLHVGCGSNPLPDWAQGFKETRLDIDPGCSPDIVASMVSLGDIGPFDAVLCVHALEHLMPHEVGVALGEFHRVLRPGGLAIVFVPDLEDARPTEEVLFTSPAGPITGLDLMYGFRQVLAGCPFMAHRTGFVGATLAKALTDAGFKSTTVRRLQHFDMMGVGVK